MNRLIVTVAALSIGYLIYSCGTFPTIHQLNTIPHYVIRW
jgi:hypothetical protein